MTDYKSSDVTSEALGIAKRFASEREEEGAGPLGRVTDRIPLSGSLDPRKGKKDVKISAKALFDTLRQAEDRPPRRRAAHGHLPDGGHR